MYHFDFDIEFNIFIKHSNRFNYTNSFIQKNQIIDSMFIFSYISLTILYNSTNEQWWLLADLFLNIRINKNYYLLISQKNKYALLGYLQFNIKLLLKGNPKFFKNWNRNIFFQKKENINENKYYMKWIFFEKHEQAFFFKKSYRIILNNNIEAYKLFYKISN